MVILLFILLYVFNFLAVVSDSTEIASITLTLKFEITEAKAKVTYITKCLYNGREIRFKSISCIN